uniref:Uncharacterized protein n=1 Tax=Arundo donax TaxID=35708 RepID=A0A0A8YK88_ARUDO
MFNLFIFPQFYIMCYYYVV